MRGTSGRSTRQRVPFMTSLSSLFLLEAAAQKYFTQAMLVRRLNSP